MAFGLPSFATVLNLFAFVLGYKMCQLTEHSLSNPICCQRSVSNCSALEAPKNGKCFLFFEIFCLRLNTNIDLTRKRSFPDGCQADK